MGAQARTTTTAVAVLMVAAIFAAALPRMSAQAPASAPMMPPFTMAPSPAGEVDCMTYLLQLSDCLTFVESGSNLTIPDRGCCPELANLVDSEPICLCQLLGNPAQTGLPIDIDRALMLPAVCNVTTPPVSMCPGAGVPVGSPLSPSEAPLSDGGSVAASPTPGNPSNWSPSSLATKHHYLIGLVAVLSTYLF
ncbi:hypothetical protein ABFS83_04G069400 [Erythranthe nasuta]